MTLRLTICFLLGIFAVSVASAGDDGDSTKATLDKARNAYEVEKEAIRKTVLELFDKKDAEARDRGDKKQVDLIKEERQGYQLKGETPKWVPLATQRRMILARESMTSAYQVAIKEYLQAKKDAEAALVEKELKLFQEAGAKPPEAADALQIGTRWTGTRTINTTQPWSLKVLRREGVKFAGEITIDKTRTYAVEGVIDRGRVTFATEKKGNFHQACDGQIKGEEITLALTGTSGEGKPIRGTAKLTLKK